MLEGEQSDGPGGPGTERSRPGPGEGPSSTQGIGDQRSGRAITEDTRVSEWVKRAARARPGHPMKGTPSAKGTAGSRARGQGGTPRRARRARSCKPRCAVARRGVSPELSASMAWRTCRVNGQRHPAVGRAGGAGSCQGRLRLAVDPYYCGQLADRRRRVHWPRGTGHTSPHPDSRPPGLRP